MRFEKYLNEIKIGKTEINYAITPDNQLGIYIQTIGTIEKFQRKGEATKAILNIINNHPKNRKITFSSPLSKGGEELTKSLVRKGVLSPEVDKFGTSKNIFLINR